MVLTGSRQPLGQLPVPRVTPSKSFSKCAVDYAGPMLLHQGGQRSKSFTIWKSWSRDYLHQRNKWKKQSKNLSVGQLVLILDDTAPPLVWKRGIVTQTYLGQDSLVRVANVRTANGILRRPIHKVCPLPVLSLIHI